MGLGAALVLVAKASELPANIRDYVDKLVALLRRRRCLVRNHRHRRQAAGRMGRLGDPFFDMASTPAISSLVNGSILR
jgi:hypothetical protein